MYDLDEPRSVGGIPSQHSAMTTPTSEPTRESKVESLSYILGDIVFLDKRRPTGLDLQTAAFSRGVASIVKNLKNSRKQIVRTMLMFDHPGAEWRGLLAPGTSLKVARSPHIGDLNQEVFFPLKAAAMQLALPSDIIENIEAVPEEKLRSLLKRKLPGLIADTEGCFRRQGVIKTSEATGNPVVSCNGVAASLFLRAATYPNDSERQVETVKAYFQRDNAFPDRVELNTILRGAVFAQAQLGMSAQAVVHYYTPISGLEPHHQAFVVKNGEIIEVN